HRFGVFTDMYVPSTSVPATAGAMPFQPRDTLQSLGVGRAVTRELFASLEPSRTSEYSQRAYSARLSSKNDVLKGQSVRSVSPLPVKKLRTQTGALKHRLHQRLRHRNGLFGEAGVTHKAIAERVSEGHGCIALVHDSSRGFVENEEGV